MNYIYRRRENGEYLGSMKPKDMGREEEVLSWEALRGVLGKRRMRKRLRWRLNRATIRGVRVEGKGVRGRRRRSKKMERVIGSVKRKTEDERWEKREMVINSRRGKRTRKIWIGMEGLPIGERRKS